MAPLRIGLVSESYFPTLGGIQEHVRHLRNYLRGQAVEVTVLTGSPSTAPAIAGPRDANVNVLRVGRARAIRTGGTYTQGTVGPTAVWNFARALRAEKFDLLNIHGPCDFGLPFLALSMFGGPKVLTLHSCFPDARWRRISAPYYRWVFKRAAAVIAVSRATADSMQRYADFDPIIVPNGVDTPYWHARPNARYLRPGFRNIVYLGRLEDRNGPDLMIDAFSEIANAVPDVRLLIAGDGPRRAALEARVPPALRTRVEFVGAVYSERPELLASASLFLLPARAVGFSIMVLEAYAAGLPVVSIPALGTDRAGDHWSNVIMARAATASAFADAVIGALGQVDHQRIARGRAIAATFDWSRVGAQILDVFSSVVPAKAADISRVAA
jgi:phosphatidylinositol alpha-mannosyltransferase